jgi:imidazolonepropionase-like amidohydrolase
MRRFGVLITALIAILFAFPAWAQTVAIRAGNVIDPATGKVATNQIILVKDQKIAEIGPGVSIPSDAQVIDLSNEWLMPGVMDTHTHITFLEHDLQHTLETNYLIEGKGTRVLFGLKTSQILLNAGITTVRDVGNEAEYASVDVRNAIKRGWFTGPTILTSGKIIAPFGGQGKNIPPEVGPVWRYEYIDADGPQEIRKAVRENIFYGADLIKLVSDNTGAYYYSEEEIRAATNEAHSANRAVAVHVLGGQAARNVIMGGADSIEHGWTLDDDLLRRAAGVPPNEILKAMTTNAAELLRIQKERGAIATGLYADIIAMPSSPLDDIESMRKINFVMKNGAVIRNDAPKNPK